MPRSEEHHKSFLKGPEGATVVYLLDVATDLEARLLEKWIRSHGGAGSQTIRIRSSRRGKGGDNDELEARVTAPDDPFLIAVRVVWMAPEKEGRRSVRWSDVMRLGDPRDPRGFRAYWIRTFRPRRVRLIAAQGAHAAVAVAAYESSEEIDGVGPYMTRQAWRLLDRAERQLRGNRYKIPRFVPEAILSRRDFVEAVNEFADGEGMDRQLARKRAEHYLREIAATHSPYMIDLIANAIHALYRQGYGEIRYDEAEVADIAKLGEASPVVFLPAHRSNLDRLSLQFMLWENDLPPNHTAGGINLNFFPLGPLLRRTGVFFIRRSFKDNDLYKLVLRSYIDFLIESRFPLEWYLEGGRSRSGKLGAARFGLLNYIVGSLQAGKSEDIKLVPVSIAYDQIQDVPDYAREAQGRGKEEESFGWLIRAVRSLRRRYGDIHIRFGEAVSAAALLDEIDESEEDSIGLQKLAFEIMYRIGRVTPITPTASVSIALLAARGSAKTAAGLAEICAPLMHFIKARGLPLTEDVDLSDPDVVRAILQALAEHGNVSSHEAVGRRVYWLDDDQMIRLSYYRNVVVHYFVPRAIAEMALTSMIEDGERDPAIAKQRMLDLRDLLKFEFYFQEKDRFVVDVSDDIAIDVPDWESTLPATGALGVVAKMGAPVAYWAVLSFLDAYQVVGDELEALKGPFDEKKFLKACLARARMYRIEEKLISGESASQVLFKTALALARNRDLIEDGPDVERRRATFADEVRAARSLAAAGLEG
ncbi:MAG: 1-acyl-sn-glycerol-3-phosphate acyltransferase [Actinomycetota bacterium]|nr:1-acyl-sn-glycerol-3-phosphate acyltransferase [Actinomycetota bacterium]